MNSLAWVAAILLVGCMYQEANKKVLTSSLKKGAKSPAKMVKIYDLTLQQMTYLHRFDFTIKVENNLVRSEGFGHQNEIG